MAGIPILSDIFGQKPQVIPWMDVLLGDAQLQALMSNIKDFPQIEQLGNLWQNYILAGYEKAVPGFGKLLHGITGGVGKEIDQATQWLSGLIPKDVLAQTARTGAFQALKSTGGTGSPLELSGQAAQFGLTSQAEIGLGANLLGNASQRWQQLANFGQTTMAPIQQMLITPQEQFGANLTNEVNRQRTQQEAANVAAAPNPIAKGLSDLVAYITAAYVSHGGSLGSKPPAAQDYSGMTDVGVGSQQYPSTSGMDVFGPTSFQEVPTSGMTGAPGPNDLVAGGVTGTNVAAQPTSINDLLTLPSSDPLPDSTPYGAYGGYAGMASATGGSPWFSTLGMANSPTYPGFPGLPPDAPENF